ncbi:hypothetical protein BC830DRAFT_1113196 [Chytriomyces sp. MP71]|nr:hypothetical protein BC830DRAFT_1113196 [Chytriomyces sp. MP71]
MFSVVGKRVFSSTSAVHKLKSHVMRDASRAPTPPRVYPKLRSQLSAMGTTEDGSASQGQLPADGAAAVAAAREAVSSRMAAIAAFSVSQSAGDGAGVGAGAQKAFDAAVRMQREGAASQAERAKNPHERLRRRLAADGGDKIITVRSNVLHTMHSRFVPLLSELRGLSLQDALNSLAWHRKRISRKVSDALEQAMVKAKYESNFNLEQTYVADAFIKADGAVLSSQFKRRFLRGRGRYGATQHPITGMLEITLQERDRPFKRRAADPLEWIRTRFRSRVAGGSRKVMDVYEKAASKKVVKDVYC